MKFDRGVVQFNPTVKFPSKKAVFLLRKMTFPIAFHS